MQLMTTFVFKRDIHVPSKKSYRMCLLCGDWREVTWQDGPRVEGMCSQLMLRDVLKRQVPTLSLFLIPPFLPPQPQKKTENYFFKLY
jgi:hypothetical protein